jgi:hypothetical protein
LITRFVTTCSSRELGLDVLHRLAHDRVERDLDRVQLEAVLLDPRDVEQLRGELLEASGVAEHAVQGAVQDLRRHHAIPLGGAQQPLRAQPERRERGPQLVRRDPQELLAQVQRPPRLLEQSRVVDRQRHPAPELDRELGVGPGESVRGRRDQRQHADHHVADTQRHEHRAARAEPADELDVVLVDAVDPELILGQHGNLDRLAGPQDLPHR